MKINPVITLLCNVFVCGWTSAYATTAALSGYPAWSMLFVVLAALNALCAYSTARTFH